MMDLKYGLRLDERYRWWYGDTDLFHRASPRYGKFYYPNVVHHSPNGNLVENRYLQELAAEDAELFGRLRAI
jgi:hypothetical protein